MNVEPSMAALGAIIAVPARANILSALFDGRAQTASELALAARVTPQTTSSHLAMLVEAGLLAVERHGRHRYYRLAGPAVADALEPLTLISPHRPTPMRGKSLSLEKMRDARMCYDHLAGRLGVAVTQAMTARKLLVPKDSDYSLSSRGLRFCEGLGIDVSQARAQRRMFARRCLDWSERRYHLAGSLGAAIAECFMKRHWLEHKRGQRGIVVTAAGSLALQNLLGVES